MSTNLEYRARERQRKRESRRQASEAQREKKTKETFFVGRTNQKTFVAQVTNFPRETFFSLNQKKKPLRMIWTILKQNKPEKPHK